MTYNTQVVLSYFKEMKLPYCVPEFAFCEGRKWRFDFAFPNERVAVEIQGAIFSGGRHVRGAAMLREWQKLNEAAKLGWRILYCQPSEICTMAMVETIRAAAKYGKEF